MNHSLQQLWRLLYQNGLLRFVNTVADDVLSDDEQSKKWDFSDNLVGKVKNEIQIPFQIRKIVSSFLNNETRVCGLSEITTLKNRPCSQI